MLRILHLWRKWPHHLDIIQKVLLFQAFSWTSRILDELKSQGNVVCFRYLKARTDEAITLFSNKNAKEDIITAPYEDFLELFSKAHAKLFEIAPTVGSVDTLPHEEAQAEFLKAFGELMRLRNILSSFVDFDEDDLAISPQQFADYKSKYLDLF